jgi:enoyl-[acyl-carrier-protein] reductase (NADH)
MSGMVRCVVSQGIFSPAIFLASDLAAYVSGTIVMVDGGYMTV